MTSTIATKPNYLLVNGNGVPAVPIAVASIVIKKWCFQNPNYPETPGTNTHYAMKPYNILAELSGVSVRRMFDLYHGIPIRGRTKTKEGVTCYRTHTISVDSLDKIITRGMDQPELWYAPPLDVYYLPLDEWTDEMRARHERI